MNLSNLMQNGMPLLGTFVYGPTAAAVALVLDLIGPLVFLYGLWTRKTWAPLWATLYIGLFVLNSGVAGFTVRDALGPIQILAPALVCIGFLAAILWKRSYFSEMG